MDEVFCDVSNDHMTCMDESFFSAVSTFPLLPFVILAILVLCNMYLRQ